MTTLYIESIIFVHTSYGIKKGLLFYYWMSIYVLGVEFWEGLYVPPQ